MALFGLHADTCAHASEDSSKSEKKDGIETGNGGNAIMTVPVHATAPCVC
jgi:hypothetical protein